MFLVEIFTPKVTVFPVIVAAVINFFSEMDFSRPAQPTAHFCPHYTASAVTIGGRLLLKGGYKYRKYGSVILESAAAANQ